MKTSLQILLFSLLIFGQILHAQCDVSENFDTYVNNDIPTGWTVINTTGQTNNIYAKVQTSNQAPSPSKYLRMYNGSAISGDLIFVAPQVAGTSDGNHRVKFWLQGTSTSLLDLGTVDTNDNTATFELISSILLSNDWTYYEVTIPIGTNQYLAFRHNLGDPFDQINFDSICLQEIPTCLEVSNITLSNPSTTTIDLSWDESATDEDSWEYIVQEIGGIAPTQTTTGTAHTSTSTNPLVTVSSLTMDTEYEAYVRSNCGAGDYGEWIIAADTLRTDCGLITDNFCEDWDGIPENSVPFCWSVYDDPATSGYAHIDYEFSGYNKNMFELFFTSTTVVGDIVAISPNTSYAMDGNHRLSFTSGASTDAIDALEVGTINTAGDFVLITTITPTSDRDKQYFVSLPNNDHVKFAFRHGGVINKYVWINTVCVEDIPSCLEVTDVAATNVQFDSADISWNSSDSTEDTWEYIVQESSLPAPAPTINGTETTAMTVNVTLDQNTEYIAYVRAKCDTADYGAWISSEIFTTTCDGVVAEYSNSFEGLNEDGQEIKPCWSVFDTTSGDFRTYESQNNIVPSDGNLMLRMFFSSSSNTEGLILSTPETTDISTDKQIRLKMNKSASTTEGFNIIVGTMSDPLDPTTFVVLDDTTLNETNIIAETWTEFTVDFTNYNTSLNHSYIAFKPQHSGNGSNFKNVYMDEYKYEFKSDLGFNDEAITAAVLTASDDFMCNNAITGDFTGATQSAEFPCANPTYTDYNDIWYRFTPETSGRYAFGLDTLSGDDMSMYIFEGSSIDLNALSSACSSRYTALELEGGITYFVAVASPEALAQFSLCVYKYPEIPTNDEITNATVLLESVDRECNNIMEGYTGSATFSIDSACSPATQDVWYSFTPAETGEYTFRRRFVNGSGVTGVSVYSGTPGNLTALTTCASQRVLADLVQGEQYYVAVSTTQLSQPVYFTLCAYKSPPAPDNDVCDAPVEIIVGETFEENEIIATNISATVDLSVTPLPICGKLDFEINSRDVWFEVVVPNSGNFVIETRFQDDSLLADTAMETYTGNCGVDSLIPFEYEISPGVFTHCSDQFVIGGNQYAGMRFTDKQPGQIVHVRVWGWAAQFGDFKIAAYDDSPTCNYPTNIQVNDITETTALVTWDAPSPVPAGGYQYIVQSPSDIYPGSATGIQTNDTEVTLENLTPNTDYVVWVKSNCGANGSAWEASTAFTTEMELGVNDFGNEGFTYFPNPAKDILNVSYTTTIKNITVYSLTGKKVIFSVINATSGKINLSGLASGMYLIKAETDIELGVFKLFVE
ncbi:hypothetical protein ULMS_16230 [Patiriisocius marinistellae]|uniref:Fibronectin type-III domain-containing protein n=1 Tax=Patiriisocius marinistellae TaxID=2494560 RepID=A0A5J4G173_9FLAO|nr:fibronectin type III domain-containing protein [Patiriisocius marinistellae]GEQ86115.1 hypothetical protein ULMS_16230 [Patiriisocius marinistellae]